MTSQKWDVAVNSKSTSGHFIMNNYCHFSWVAIVNLKSKSVHPLFSSSFVNVVERRAATSSGFRREVLQRGIRDFPWAPDCERSDRQILEDIFGGARNFGKGANFNHSLRIPHQLQSTT